MFTRFRMHRRGKRASALVKLRQRGFRTVLPGINLVNLRCLPNKTDKLLLFSQTNEDFSNSAALCFTETLLNINERWCTDITVLKKMCCSDCETFVINGKLFYSPWEICSFILVSVYIPPQAHMSLALQKLTDQITDTEQKHPDSVLIILLDFNKANLSRELPKYRQHITCTTRDSNILDPCYTTIKYAFRSVQQATLGLFDHCLVHLIPTYRQKLKSAKYVLRTVKRRTNEAAQDLKGCFDLTVWSVFETAANDLDELTETVTSYISFCEICAILTGLI